ncbi:ATP-binding protein [Bacillus tianshenii]|nr:ATP-binding protein [Bacillus tianshenii]
MKFTLPKGVTLRFLIFGFLFVFIPLTVTFIFAVVLSEDTLQEQQKKQALASIKTTASKTDQLLLQKLNTLKVNVAKFNDRPEGFSYLYKNLDILASQDPILYDIFVFNNENKLMHYSPIRTSTITISKDMKLQLEDLSWCRCSFVSGEIQQTRKGSFILLNIPIQEHYKSTLHGKVIARIKAGDLQKYYQNNIIGENGRTILLDTQGTVLMDTTSKETIGKNLQSLSFYQDIYLEKKGVFYGSFLNEEALIAHFPVDHFPFTAITVQPKSEANSPVYTLTRVLTIGWLAIFALGILFLFIGTKIISKPIKQLTQQASSYALGEKWQLAILREKDELKTLENTMHYMAKSLKAKEEHLQHILESFPFGVITMNTDGNVTSINKSGADLLGMKKEEIIDKPIHHLPLPLKKHLITCKEASNRYEGLEDEYTYTALSKKKVTMKRSSSPLLDENEQIIGVVTTFWDITRVKQLKKHLQRSEQLRAIGQMTAGLAHEIKNPLGTIQMASDVVESELNELKQEYNLSEESTELFEETITDIQDEIKRLDDIVRRFLRFSRSRSKAEQEINLTQVLKELLQLLSHQFKRNNMKVEANLPSKPCMMIGDRNQLIQSFLNIILNSIEASKEDKRLIISLTENDGMFECCFEDNGVGMEETKIERIFNPFYSTKQEGTGLGLWITHEMISAHNGHIEVESAPNQGTTFTVYLPKLENKEH